jgi:hypothetical protein
MNFTTIRVALAISCSLPLLFSTGCRNVETIAEEHTERVHLELDKSEMVQVKLAMGAGELKVRGGSSKLLDGEFTFRGNARPEVHYDASSFRGKLTVQSASMKDGINFGSHGGRWDIALNETVPMNLEVHMGAGENDLDLGRLNLRDLTVHMGAGRVKLDLRGDPTRSMNVQVHGGVGEAVVYVPNTVGVRMEGHGGIGSIDVRGLLKRGDHYENELYSKAAVRMNVQIHGGVGSIKVYAE